MANQTIDYASRAPTTRRHHWVAEAVPYVLFVACAALSAGFARPAMRYNGNEEWFFFVFFGLGAVVLPQLAQKTISG